MIKDILIPQEKSKIYELLAQVFAKEPSDEFLRWLQLKDNQKLFKAYGISLFPSVKNLTFKEQEELLAIEYARLFLLPGAKTMPRESLQRGQERLWADSTVEVSRIYKKFGFALDEGFKDTPDHLSAELSFLAGLSELEAKYTFKGLEEAKKGVLEVKKYFLKNHLLLWFSAWQTSLTGRTKLAYYRELAQFTVLILNEEWENLQTVKDICPVS